MGIPRLYSYISTIAKKFDLIQKAHEVKDMEILVDFSNFRRWLDKFILIKIIKDYDNKYLATFCFEYDIFTKAYCDFNEMFAEMGIKLVWVVDGVKGIDKKVNAHRLTTWYDQSYGYSKFVDSIFKSCRDREPITDLDNYSPFYNKMTFVKELKKSGAEVVKLLQGGSNEFIASEFHRRKSFAILTNNTDFFVFKDCTVILGSSLVEYNKEMFDNYFQKPESFCCEIVTQQEVMRSLGLSQEQMVILSILQGNCNTNDYYTELMKSLRIKSSKGKWPQLIDVVNYIRSKQVNRGNLYNLYGMKTFLQQNSGFIDEAEFSFDFYTLKHYYESSGKNLIIFDPNVDFDSLTSFFQRKLSNIELSDEIYAAHFGNFDNTTIFEKPTESSPSISQLLSEIRSRVYPFIVDESLKSVIERKLRNSSDEKVINVERSKIKSDRIIGKPGSELEREKEVVYGIDIFEKIWSNLRNENSLNFVEKFGFEGGFRCYILRYLYKITKNRNLNLLENEFQAIFAMAFSKPYYGTEKRDLILKMKIFPSERCLIIFSWFLQIYYTGKYFCGSALNYLDDLPSSEDIISSGFFTAFYETNMNDINERVGDLDASIINGLENNLLKSFEVEYQEVTQDN